MASSSSPRQRETRIGIAGTRWLLNGAVTYLGSPAEGLLLNVRMINAVAEDLAPPPFDAAANTARFVARVSEYVACGVRAFTIGLQGGSLGYEGVVNTAFLPEGALKPAYLARVQQVIEACDTQGAVVIVSLYYQRQDQHLRDEAAVRRGVGEVARWVLASGFTNVVLEIANEYGHRGFTHPILRAPEGIAGLIRLAKAEARGLLVSASTGGRAEVDPAVAGASDFITLHFNHTSLAEISGRVAAAQVYGKPVLCNEDAKIGEAGAAALRAAVAAGCGWGLMDLDGNQIRPFTFEAELDDLVIYREMRRLTTATTAGTSPPPGGPQSYGPAVGRPATTYFPPPESAGGWRVVTDRREIAARGLDPDRLEELAAWNLSIQNAPPREPSHIGFLVLHDGWIVCERYARPEQQTFSGPIASIGKSITSCAFGRWIEAGRRGGARLRLELESPVYDPRFLPEGFPLSDPRKEAITFFHVLTHTSGLQPEPDTRRGEGYRFVDYTVGKCAAYPESATLAFDPGRGYGYSSVGFNHFALVAPHLTGRPLHEEVAADLLAPIGIESAIWQDVQQGYRPAAGGPPITARDLARYAYLHLHDGRWDGRTIVPCWYLRASRQVVRINEHQRDDYGLGSWTNHALGFSPALPRDSFAFGGSGLNTAIVVPSWQLVVVRLSRVWRMDFSQFLPEFTRRIADLVR